MLHFYGGGGAGAANALAAIHGGAATVSDAARIGSHPLGHQYAARLSYADEAAPTPRKPARGGLASAAAGDVDACDAAPLGPKPPATAAEAHEELIGTALVLAFLQCCQLVPTMSLAAEVSGAARHFYGTTTPAGRTFEETYSTSACRASRLY